VENLHGRVGGVDALAAGSGGAADGDLQVLRLEDDVDLLRFGQDGDGDGAGVDAALGFGGRHPLDPVDAALVLQAAVNILPVMER
jgi:hypothetical protein